MIFLKASKPEFFCCPGSHTSLSSPTFTSYSAYFALASLQLKRSAAHLYVQITARASHVVQNWVLTTNHRRIAILYFSFIAISGFTGLVLATLIRLELAYPGQFWLAQNAERYLTIISLHGIVMVFFMIIPVIFGAFGNFLLPTQLGIRDVAFPRLNSFMFWVTPAGFVLLLHILLFDRAYNTTYWVNYSETRGLLRRRYSMPSTQAARFSVNPDNTVLAWRFINPSSAHAQLRSQILHEAAPQLTSPSNNIFGLRTDVESFPSLIKGFQTTENFNFAATLKPLLKSFSFVYRPHSTESMLLLAWCRCFEFYLTAQSRVTLVLGELLSALGKVLSAFWESLVDTAEVAYYIWCNRAYWQFGSMGGIFRYTPAPEHVAAYGKRVAALHASWSISAFEQHVLACSLFQFCESNLKLWWIALTLTPAEHKKWYLASFKETWQSVEACQTLLLEAAVYAIFLRKALSKLWAQPKVFFLRGGVAWPETSVPLVAAAPTKDSMPIRPPFDNLFAVNHVSDWRYSVFAKSWLNLPLAEISTLGDVLASQEPSLNPKFLTAGHATVEFWNDWRALKLEREVWRTVDMLSLAKQQLTFRKKFYADLFNPASLTNKVSTWLPNHLIPGWAFITPYTSRLRYTAIGKVDVALVVVLAAALGSVFSSVNYVITYRYLGAPILKNRRELRSFFVDGLLVGSRMMLLANPALIIGVILLLSDRHFDTSVFDFSGGGDTILFQHLFWFFGHPEVYIIIIPCFGIMNSLLPFYLKKRLSGRLSLQFSMYTIAFMSFAVWGHHMYMVGLANSVRTLYSTMTVMISVPASTKVLHWCVTLIQSSLTCDVGFLFLLNFFYFFVLGGLSGMFNAHIGFDTLLHDTFYVIGHFHVMLAGAAMSSVFAAFYFYFAAIFGVRYSRFFAYLHYSFYTAGQLLTLIPMFWLGYAGMPRRIMDYPSTFGGWHSLASSGHLLTVLSFIFFLAMLIDSMLENRVPLSHTRGVSRLNTRLAFFTYEIRKLRLYQSRALPLAKSNNRLYLQDTYAFCMDSEITAFEYTFTRRSDA